MMTAVLLLALAAPLPFPTRPKDFPCGEWVMRRADYGEPWAVRMFFEPDGGGWVDGGGGRKPIAWSRFTSSAGVVAVGFLDSEGRTWSFRIDRFGPPRGKMDGDLVEMRRAGR